MGLLKKSKVDTIARDAAAAAAAGHQVFVGRFWDEVLAFQGTGAIAGASEAINEVESQGWKLEHVAYAWAEGKNRGLTVVVFRRAP